MPAADLRKRWQELAGRFCSDDAAIDAAWIEIENGYSEQGRHYHTLSHVAALFLLEDEYARAIVQPEAFGFAIFYHDLIYKVARSDNEAMSAVAARRRLEGLGADDEIVGMTCGLIEATAHMGDGDLPGGADAALLIDFDLCILGASRRDYAAYAEAVRREYAIYSDDDYGHGREQVLCSFLARPQIYHTPELFARWEEPARENLSWELAHLTAE